MKSDQTIDPPRESPGGVDRKGKVKSGWWIYTHVMNKGARGVKSPLDRLGPVSAGSAG
jgi:hypothetical protein